MKIKKNSKLSQKKKLVILLASVFIAIAGYLSLAALNGLFPFPTNDPSDLRDYTVNYDRTETEKAVTDKLNDDPGSKTENPQNDKPTEPPVNPDTNKRGVNVLLTNVSISGGTVSASGFVTNVTENDGSCEYIFTNGNSTVRKKTETLPNPTSTTCKTVHFPASELAIKGGWNVELRYDSTISGGISPSREVSY